MNAAGTLAKVGPTRSQDFPWGIGQSCTDDLVAYAADRNSSFEVRMGRNLAQAFIGGRLVGYLNADTLDLIKWPFTWQPMTERDHIEAAHRRADQGRSIAKCYFIGGKEGAIKIGYSVDVAGRLATIQSHSPIPVAVLATCDGGEARESAYHRQFDEYRLHGEWFERHPDILAEIDRLNERPARQASSEALITDRGGSNGGF